MGSWQELPEWAQELAEYFQEGESALFILHGQVFDYTRVNGDYLPFRHFLGHWLSPVPPCGVLQSRPGVGVLGTTSAKTPSGKPWSHQPRGWHRGKKTARTSPRVRARALRALGQQPQATPLPQSPREVLQLAERVMTAPCRQPCLSQPLALILEYAETIVPAVDLGSMGEPDRGRLWLPCCVGPGSGSWWRPAT